MRDRGPTDDRRDRPRPSGETIGRGGRDMRSSIQKSRALYEESLKYVPGGVQSSRRPDLFFDDFPIFLERARGAHIWDVDGNEYIDWMLSYGPIILGHCNEEVDRAVIEETRKGFLFNLTPPSSSSWRKRSRA
jgi:glutamate-1-semialdehyde aminotransferase